MPGAVSELNRPLLVAHARVDKIVEYENAETIYAATQESKRLLTLELADHLVSRREDAELLLTAVLDWFDETL